MILALVDKLDSPHGWSAIGSQLYCKQSLVLFTACVNGLSFRRHAKRCCIISQANGYWALVLVVWRVSGLSESGKCCETQPISNDQQG